MGCKAMRKKNKFSYRTSLMHNFYKEFKLLEQDTSIYIDSDYESFIDISEDRIERNSFISKSNMELFKLIECIKSNNAVVNTCINQELENIKEALIVNNIKLINWCIRKCFFDIDIDKIELQMLGLEGLIIAINHYNYTQEYNFSIYALVVIRRTIERRFKEIKGVFWNDFTCIESLIFFRELMKDSGYTRREIEELEKTSIKGLSSERIEYLDKYLQDLYFGLKRDGAINNYLMNNGIDSMDINQLSDYDCIDQFEDQFYSESLNNCEDTAMDNIEQIELKILFKKILSTLTESEQKVMCEYYGINSAKYSIDDLSNKIGLTGSRIYQIKKQALSKLRHISRARYFCDYADVRMYKKEELTDGDYLYNKIFSLRRIGMNSESVLQFMNMDGLNWSIIELYQAMQTLDEIAIYCRSVINDSIIDIIHTIENDYHITFSVKFIKFLLLDYEIGEFINRNEAQKKKIL